MTDSHRMVSRSRDVPARAVDAFASQATDLPRRAPDPRTIGPPLAKG